MAIDRNAKIVAKIADNNAEPDFLEDIFKKYGADVAWLNTAHMLEENTLDVVNKIWAVDENIPILIDTKGPEIRTKNIEDPIELAAGEEFIMTGDESVTGDKVVVVDYANFAAEVPAGTEILIDDGEFQCEVKSVDGAKLICVAENEGKIKKKKSVNVPTVHINLPALSEKDKRFIHFCAQNKIDYVIHSFVRGKSDLDEIKAILNEYEDHGVKIIAKIENREGFENVDEILENCEGLMVARGDLGVEVPFEEVPYMQKRMADRAVELGKYSIVATQSLHTMIENPRPTRAEVSDVANAVLDGADAVSMSGETAYGKYPREAVQTMDRIMRFTEKHRYELNISSSRPVADHPLHTIAESVVFAADSSEAKFVLIPSDNPRIAQALASFSPGTPVFAIANNRAVVRELGLAYSVHPRFSESDTVEGKVKTGLAAMKSEAKAEDADRIVIVTPANDGEESFDIKVSTIGEAAA